MNVRIRVDGVALIDLGVGLFFFFCFCFCFLVLVLLVMNRVYRLFLIRSVRLFWLFTGSWMQTPKRTPDSFKAFN